MKNKKEKNENRHHTAIASMAKADWSELPKELLNLISQLFDIEIDLIRFRSVCSTWRSSSIPNHHQIFLHFKFPLPKLPLDIDSINKVTLFCSLTKQSVFLIKPLPQQDQTLLRPWLIRVSEDSNGKTLLLNPLIPQCYHIPFPRFINFNKFSLLHLRTNFDSGFPFPFHHANAFRLPRQPGDYIFPEKVVAVTCHGKKPLVLGTFEFNPHMLLLKCSDDVYWKVIPDMSVEFGDICIFNGRAYAVDEIGRTVMVGPDNSDVRLAAEPLVGGGHIKFLVESEGDLLLADVYNCLNTGFPNHDPVRIDLFKLNEKEKKWVKLASLGDRVLFLGLVCSFSISASDLYVPVGNCVIFMDSIFESCPLYREPAMCILHLDQARLSPLSDYPEYFNLLREPPEWIVKS